MARNSAQNASEERDGVRGEPMFSKDEEKFCSRILDASSTKPAVLHTGCVHTQYVIRPRLAILFETSSTMNYLAATLLLVLAFWPGEALAAVNINGATFEELDALPGVGEVTINKIIDYRDSSGAFTNISQVCALVGTNGVSVDTQTCKNIEAEIYFGPLGAGEKEENGEEEDEHEESTASGGTDSNDKDNEPAKPVTSLTLQVPEVVYVGQLVSFDVNPAGGTADRLVRYSWNFGEGHTSKDKSPKHQYTRSGTYVVAVESYFQKETKLARREIKVLPLSVTLTTLPGGGIEVTNEGEHELDLSGLSINGKDGFTFAKNTILLPSERLVVEGISGPVATLKDVAGKTLAVEKPPAKASVPASTKRVTNTVAPRVSLQSATKPAVETAIVSEASTTSIVENTAAVSNAMVPSETWPYLGLLAVMAFGFIALLSEGRFP